MTRISYEIYHYCDMNMIDVGLHFHDFYECYYLLSGNIRYQIENEFYALIPGDLLLMSPNHLHRPLFVEQDAPCAYERIVLWIATPYLKRLSEEADLSQCFHQAHASVFHLPKIKRIAMEQRFFALIESSFTEGFAKELLCRAQLTALLIELSRELTGSGEALVKRASQKSALVCKVLDYLDAHIEEKLCLDALAEHTYLSKYHLSRLFHRESGVTISQMLAQKRMILARDLLHKGMPIQAVSMRCGFSDYSSFYKAFVKEYGISPREYVRRYAQ